MEYYLIAVPKRLPGFLSLAVVVNAHLTKCISSLPRPSHQQDFDCFTLYFKWKCMRVTEHETAEVQVTNLKAIKCSCYTTLPTIYPCIVLTLT